MKNKHHILLALLIGITMLNLVLNIYTVQKIPKTAYVQNDQVFSQFKGKIELEQRLFKEEQQQKTLLDSMELDLKVIQNKLTEDKNNVELKQVFYDKGKLYQELKRNYQEKIQQQSQQFTSEIWKQINQYTLDFGKNNNYSYIYGVNGTGSMMYGKQHLDVTSAVIEYINRQYEGG